MTRPDFSPQVRAYLAELDRGGEVTYADFRKACVAAGYDRKSDWLPVTRAELEAYLEAASG